MSIPRWMCIRVPNLFPIGPAVWRLSHIFEFVTPWPPPNAPWARVVNFCSLCPFPGESVYVPQIWSRSFQWFGSFPRFMNWWSPNPPHAPRVSRGTFVYPMSIPRLICIRVSNLDPIGLVVCDRTVGDCYGYFGSYPLLALTRAKTFIHRNYNSVPNMLTSKSLTSFTSILFNGTVPACNDCII